MKRKMMVCLLLLVVSAMLLAGCSSEVPGDSGKTTEGSVVHILLPANFFNADITEEEIMASAREQGMTATANADGTYTYSMDTMVHKQMLIVMAYGVDTALQDLVYGLDPSFFKGYEANEWFTRLTITVDEDFYLENKMLADALIETAAAQCNYYQVFYGAGKEACTEVTVENEKGLKVDELTFPLDWDAPPTGAVEQAE